MNDHMTRHVDARTRDEGEAMMVRHRSRSRIRILWAIVAMFVITFNLASPASASPPTPSHGFQLKNWKYDACLDVQRETRNEVRTNVQRYRCRVFSDQPSVQYQIFDMMSIPGRSPNEFKLRNQATGKCLTYPVGRWFGSPVWAERCELYGQGWRRNVDDVEAVESRYCLNAKDVPEPAGFFGVNLAECAKVNSTWFEIYP